MNVVVTTSARATFTPRELVAAYKEFTKHEPQLQDGETGIRASAYRFGERVLLAYEESETGWWSLFTQVRRIGILGSSLARF